MTAKAVTITAPERKQGQPAFMVFGRRLSPGDSVTVFEVKVGGQSFTFETEAEAHDFESAPFPKQTSTGRWLTSDGRGFDNEDRAKAREAVI